MSVVNAARIARRELRGGLRGFRILLACLTLGVAAIAAVGLVRASIEAGLSNEGAALLGGDAEMRFTYRFADANERAWMNTQALAVSEVTDFRSMAVVDRGGDVERALTQVKSVDGAYPLKGTVLLDPPIPLAEALAGSEGFPGAVLAPNLMDRLGLKTGDVIRLGTQPFVVTARLVQEPDSAGAGFSLGPRTLVRTEDLKNSELLAPGTLFETRYRLALPPGADLEALKTEATTKFRDTGARWRDSRNGAPGIQQFVDRLGAFLVLVGLSGLAVGGVGVSAAVTAYLASKTSVIATLRTLGANRQTIFLTYFFQIGALSLLGITLGLILGAAMPLLLAPVISAQLPVPAAFALHPGPIFEAAVYGVLAALIFTLWPLARTEDVRAATLFRDTMGSSRVLPAPPYLIATTALVAVLVAAAVAFSGIMALTLWAFAGVFAAMIVLVLAGAAIRVCARRLARYSYGLPPLRWALGAIGGPRENAASVVLSLGLGLSVLSAVGQIDGNLRNAIARDLPDLAPSYFFVDIQKDQMPGYLERLSGDPEVVKVESAPMLRGIITQINGQPARDVVGDHWVLRGDRGITYSDRLPVNTRITGGTWWPEGYTGPPQISFAAEQGAEMGLTLGDEITVNILGRDFTAPITSFRHVDFSTAGIGFILAMTPNTLAGAPHSFISTVYAQPQAEAAILRDLAQAYPNITAIRVRDAIDQVSRLLGGIAQATSWGAAATLLTGFLVLIGAAAAGENARTYEAAILKTLGATRRRILTSFGLRAALMGLSAGAVALIAGIAGAWAVTIFVMETAFAVIWGPAIGIILGGIVATLAASLGFAWRALAAPPAQILRARE